MKSNFRNTNLARRLASSGVTLIELMVAMAIGLIVIAGIGYIYLQGSQGFRVQDSQSRIQEDVRFITEIVTRDIRNARYMGCFGATEKAGAPATLRFTGAHPWFSNPSAIPPSSVWLMKDGGDATKWQIQGIPNMSYVLRGFDDANGWPNTPSLSGRREPGTDVLMFMKLSDEMRPIKDPQDAMSEIEIIGDAFPGVKTDGKLAVMAVTSCALGTEIIKPTVRNGGKKFELDNTYNKVVKTINGTPLETTTTVFKVSPDAMLARFEPVSYYISKAANNPSTNLPTLNRVSISDMLSSSLEAVQTGVWDDNGGNAIASGVENMQLKYLVDGQYRTATEVNGLGIPNTFWQQVRAVEVTLTIISQDENARSKSESQTLRDGTTVTDRRLRQEVKFVVDLPNF
jgi:prepilin-type N-terminal cleavage/methylation domain-containing protein